MKALRVCAESGCPNLSMNTRCGTHRKQKRKTEDARRPNAKARGYDAKWRATRYAYLRAFPICQWHEGCISPAVDVHHLDGKGPHGARGHDWMNLQGLCRSHHSQTTAREQPGGFR